jgi:putative NADPH-quinone reductase
MKSARRIAVILGHPDPRAEHFCHALAEAYAHGAREGGHEVRVIDAARAEFPLLRSAQEWKAPPVEAIRQAQLAIGWADHLVLVFPLWLGDMPALFKAFLEQVLRPGFAIREAAPGRLWKKLLKGKSARVMVTMGMPAFFYRIYYRAHSIESLKRNILDFCGIGPVRTSLIGMIEADEAAREKWLAEAASLGRKGQ